MVSLTVARWYRGNIHVDLLLSHCPMKKRSNALIHVVLDWSHEAMACSNGSERIANWGIYSPKASIDLRRIDTGRREEEWVSV